MPPKLTKQSLIQYDQAAISLEVRRHGYSQLFYNTYVHCNSDLIQNKPYITDETYTNIYILH